MSILQFSRDGIKSPFVSLHGTPRRQLWEPGLCLKLMKSTLPTLGFLPHKWSQSVVFIKPLNQSTFISYESISMELFIDICRYSSIFFVLIIIQVIYYHITDHRRSRYFEIKSTIVLVPIFIVEDQRILTVSLELTSTGRLKAVTSEA